MTKHLSILDLINYFQEKIDMYDFWNLRIICNVLISHLKDEFITSTKADIHICIVNVLL